MVSLLCFCVWGDVAKMDLLLEWRKVSPLDPKFILFSSIFTKLSFSSIEVRESLSFSMLRLLWISFKVA